MSDSNILYGADSILSRTLAFATLGDWVKQQHELPAIATALPDGSEDADKEEPFGVTELAYKYCVALLAQSEWPTETRDMAKDAMVE